jgi:hypothetical protein
MTLLQKLFLAPIPPRVQWDKCHMLVLKNPKSMETRNIYSFRACIVVRKHYQQKLPNKIDSVAKG